MARANFHPGSTIIVPDSALVNAVQYDPDAWVLEVQTKKGDRYRYYGVTTHVFACFVVSKSMGKFFNESIKDRFRRRKLPSRASV